jgi:hypothetical protein
MFVSKREEFRVQRWDGRCWRRGLGRPRDEAEAMLARLHRERPGETFRIIRITTTVEAGDPVGPPVPPGVG